MPKKNKTIGNSTIYTVHLEEVSASQDRRIPRHFIASASVQIFQQREPIKHEVIDWAFASIPAGLRFFTRENAETIAGFICEKYQLNPGFGRLIQECVYAEFLRAQERIRMEKLPTVFTQFDQRMEEYKSHALVCEVITRDSQRAIDLPMVASG